MAGSRHDPRGPVAAWQHARSELSDLVATPANADGCCLSSLSFFRWDAFLLYIGVFGGAWASVSNKPGFLNQKKRKVAKEMVWDG